MSLALFSIFSDLLSRMLAKAEDMGTINGVKVSRSSPKITHLMYADDLVIYYRANEKEAKTIKNILQQYGEWTGHLINFDKFVIYFSQNVQQTQKLVICSKLSMRECDHRSKYLGHTFCNFKSKVKEFNGLANKLAVKLTGWKCKVLFMAGRLILAKSVAEAIPTYTMHAFLLPKGTAKFMDSMVRKFLWGFGDQHKNHMYLRAWEKICKPKNAGGLIWVFSFVDILVWTEISWIFH